MTLVVGCTSSLAAHVALQKNSQPPPYPAEIFLDAVFLLWIEQEVLLLLYESLTPIDVTLVSLLMCLLLSP
jgi:hypothetical protein